MARGHWFEDYTIRFFLRQTDEVNRSEPSFRIKRDFLEVVFILSLLDCVRDLFLWDVEFDLVEVRVGRALNGLELMAARVDNDIKIALGAFNLEAGFAIRSLQLDLGVHHRHQIGPNPELRTELVDGFLVFEDGVDGLFDDRVLQTLPHLLSVPKHAAVADDSGGKDEIGEMR